MTTVPKLLRVPWANFVLVVLNALMALGLIWLYLRRAGVGWSAVGWRRFDVFRAALYLAALFVAFIAISYLALTIISWLDPSFDANQPQNNGFVSSHRTNPLLALAAVVFIPPVLEETVFRGFVFPAFAKRWGVIWGAVASSVLFGLAHLQQNISVYTFLLGLVLCFLYLRTKSIIPGVFLHMINNYLAFLALTTAK
jgi:membrane protease YdiL (CAAX protease family)